MAEATLVHLRCPRWVRDKGQKKGRPCGKPLTKIGEDKQGTVEMVCPDKHRKFYGHIYFSRFSLPSLDPNQHHLPKPPTACPECHISLITTRPEQRLGLIICGNCGLRLTFNEKRQAWEQAPIG